MGRLVYEWVAFSWKTGICTGLLSNSVEAHPYQNQTWLPPWDLDMEIVEEVVTRYFPKNIINHKFVQYILQVSSGNLKPMLK